MPALLTPDAPLSPDDQFDPLRPRYRRALSSFIPQASLSQGGSNFNQLGAFSPDQDTSWQGGRWFGSSPDPNAFNVSSSGPSGLGDSGQPETSQKPSGTRGAAKALASSMPPPGTQQQADGSYSTPGSLPAPAGPMPPPAAPARSAPPPDPYQQEAQKVVQRIQQRTQAGPPKPGGSLLQRLGLAVLSMTKLAPYAQQIVHPQYTQEMNAYNAAQAQDESELKALENAAGVNALSEQRAATAEQRRQQGADYAAREAERQRSTEERAQAAKESQWTKQLATITKGRESDVAYLPENSPQIPQLQAQGYQIIKDQGAPGQPGQPGQVIAIPPAMIQITKDMLPYHPGHVEGDLVPWSEHKNALSDFAKRQQAIELEKAKGLYGPEKKGTPEQQFIDDYLAKHPGSQIGDAITAYDKLRPPAPQQPSHALMIGPDGTAIDVRPGMHVPTGAMTTSGVNAVNTPTAATRTMAEKAPKVVHFVDRINQLLDANEAQLGPLQSRWNEYTAGKIGLPNQGYTQLRTDIGLLETALMNMHVGAKGGQQILDHFHNLINLATQDPQNLRAALEEIKLYAQQTAQEGAKVPPPQGGPTSGPSNSAPVVQRNKKTGEYRYSTDGGKTWQNGQPPQ